ncbi:hypothetical protein NSK_008587 [Nannochloropsis salina CCMP1776]|uniref:4'-phosphopantetheinyl transferase domain-containing protein n=1 Tax=Nannochloropsis salina CCMP1776 TaxID=1027361 RepID=A0A4D9CTH4_9STRA|nr:hypothetical protein NSK_008587 [Nannochloropsis salina CCMP1776]|eukprot:TFJ80029.1 hypothetical protein NSK_008587 [Nannochloropsis salina CCMP1776]
MYPSTVPPFSLRLNTIVSTSEASDICFDGRLAAEQLFPTSFELDMPPMGHVLALRLPVSSESQDPDREWDLSILLDSSKMDTVSRSAAKFPTLLHPKELDLAMTMSNLDSRLAFLGGRLALRRSLRKLPQPIRIEQAVLRDEKGAPALPSHVQASISHKQDLAICLLRSVEEDPNRALSNIGVDIEICQPRPSTNSIATRVLTRREQDELGGLASLGISGESELLLRFSLKESVYKAIYPFLRRYVAFQEAEVTPHVDGTSTIVLLLKGGAAEGLFEAEGHWQQVDNGRFFLTAVWVRKVEIRS